MNLYYCPHSCFHVVPLWFRSVEDLYRVHATRYLKGDTQIVWSTLQKRAVRSASVYLHEWCVVEVLLKLAGVQSGGHHHNL